MSTTQVLGDAAFASPGHPHSSLTARIDASGQAGVGMSWGGERGVAQNLGGRHIIIFLR